jgi:2-oxo-3-hexenedioate decarboxylase
VDTPLPGGALQISEARCGAGSVILLREENGMINHEALATELLHAYDHAALMPPPSARGPFLLADAYAVGQRLVALRRARGERTVGRKIGFTNTSIWAEYGVDRPLWAHVYAGTVQDAPHDTATVSLAGMVAPRIEPEIVFGIRRAVAPQTSDLVELLDHLAWYAAGFEIVDCHLPGWRFTSADCAADFGLHARLIIGRRIPIDHRAGAALIDRLACFTVRLQRDAATVASGGGTFVLGSPLHALRYLVETLDAQGEAPLGAGEVVTTGTLTPALPIQAGERWQAALDGIEAEGVRLTLTDAPARGPAAASS